MTTNRLAKSEQKSKIAAPKDEKERIRFWIERGNAYLWGDAPATEGKSAGTYIAKPRRDLEWVWNNGSYSIQPRFTRPRNGEDVVAEWNAIS